MKHNRDIETLCAMLSYRRPHGSDTEQDFIRKFILPIGVAKDPFGNLYKIVGEGEPNVLWSSHTDSVHHSGGRQRVKISHPGNVIKLDKTVKSSCLGADCAAGVWVMLEMIAAEVPGLYVFHYGEEVGCLGSGDIARNAPAFLDGIQAAIAFDRKGKTSIVTHQCSTRTCSDAFARSLMPQLPAGFVPDPGGIYTDTNEYRRIVPECTNLSVGYENAHSENETLDANFLIALRDKMVAFDASKMVIERDPKAFAPLPAWPLKAGLGTKTAGGMAWTDFYDDDGSDMPMTMYELVYHNPAAVVSILKGYGQDAESLAQEIEEYETSIGQRKIA